MSIIFLKYKTDGPDSKWIEVPFDVDAIQIEANGNMFEISPTSKRLGAFTIKCVTNSHSSVGFIAQNESVEVTFNDPKGVEVY